MLNLNKLSERIESDKGLGALLGFVALAAIFLLGLIVISEGEAMIKGRVSKEENVYISNFFENEVIENIIENEVEGMNWNKRVDFVSGESVYVQVSCEVSNQEEIESSEERIEREYECELIEIGGKE